MTLTDTIQTSRQQVAAGEAHTHEQALATPTYERGAVLNYWVLALWRNNTVINQLGLPAPYCLNSKSDGGAWNFSWKCADDRTSMFYTIFEDFSVRCREYPDDAISVGNTLAILNLAAVIISDCSEIPLANLDITSTVQKAVTEFHQQQTAA